MRCELAVDDEDLVHAAVNAIRGLGAGIFERKGVFVDASEALLDIRHDLLRPHDADDWPGTTDVRSELTAAHRGRQQRSGLGDRMDAAEHHLRRGQAADLVGRGLAVHAPDPRAERLVATGLLDLVGDTRDLERVRGAVIHTGSVRDETRTIRFASSASAARSTLIPFASREAAVRVTPVSSAPVPY